MYIWIIFYLICAVLNNQLFKVLVKDMRSSSSLIIIIDVLSGIICLLFIPFFKIRFSLEIIVYFFIFLSCIFYGINDYLSVKIRGSLSSSSYSILRQLSNSFLVFFSYILFKEKFIVTKFLGALLIIFSNIIIFFKRESNNILSIFLGVIASICNTIALIIDIKYANRFNLAFYLFLTITIPGIIIFIFSKSNLLSLKKEFSYHKKGILFLVIGTNTFMYFAKLMAYSYHRVLLTASLLSLTSFFNVILGYFILKERDNVFVKVIASVLIIVAVILVKL